MTTEDIDSRAKELFDRHMDWPKLSEIKEAMRELALQAYEEAARQQEQKPSLPHHDMLVDEGYWEGYDDACRDAAKELRALKDSLASSPSPSVPAQQAE